MLVTMLKETKATTITQFLTASFSRVSAGVARRICDAAKLSPRASRRRRSAATRPTNSTRRSSRPKFPPRPPTASPDRRGVDPQGPAPAGAGRVLRRGHASAGRLSRQPLPDRSRPGLRRRARPTTACPRDTLVELLGQSDARTLRQFLTTTFDGLGVEAADKILHAAKLRRRMSPGKAQGDARSTGSTRPCRTSTSTTGQTMTVLRYANRVPLQFQAGACAITQTIMATNWRSYGLSPVARRAAQRAR